MKTNIPTINPTNITITDPDNRLTPDAPLIGGKIGYSTRDKKLHIEINKKSEPSIITELYNGPQSNLVTKINEKDQKYSIVFNKTARLLTTLGKKTLLKEVKAGIDAIYDEIAIRTPKGTC